jgi:hypothetical protein
MNFRELYLPAIPVHRRIKMFKNLLAFATLVSLVVSWKLWVGERMFPHVPAFSSWPAFSLVTEAVIYGCMLLFCVCIMMSRKPGIFIFLLIASATALILNDVNRLQPWLFEFAILFFAMMFYNWRVDEPKDYTPVFNSIRICIALFYVWDGIHKMNSAYFHETWPWMMSVFEPLFSHKVILFLDKAFFVVPAFEILAAVALFFSTLKRIGIPVLVFIHLVNLVCLGPLGQNYNAASWPWNIFMMLLVYAAFAGRTDSKYSRAIVTLQYKPFYLVMILTLLVPVFNFQSRINMRQLTDFNAHSGRGISVELTKEAASKLPERLNVFVAELNGKKMLFIDSWAMAELNAPINTSLFVYQSVEQHLRHITCCPNDVNLRFKENSGQIASL